VFCNELVQSLNKCLKFSDCLLFGNILTFNMTVSCLEVVLVRRSAELARPNKDANTQADKHCYYVHNLIFVDPYIIV